MNYIQNVKYEVIEILKTITYSFLKTFNISSPFTENRLQQTFPSWVSKPSRKNEMSVGGIGNF
jgi:hypothetical protein